MTPALIRSASLASFSVPQAAMASNFLISLIDPHSSTQGEWYYLVLWLAFRFDIHIVSRAAVSSNKTSFFLSTRR